MLKNVLIATASTYPTAASPYLLSSGEIGVYSQALDGTLTLITGAISAAQGKLPIVIAQGVPAGKPIKQFVIQPGQKISYSYNAYAAPVPNVFVVGYDGVTSGYDLESGAAGTYDFKVQNLTLGNPPFPTLGSTPYFELASQATSVAIANAIAKDLNNQVLNINNEVMPQNKFALTEVLSEAATVQLVTSAPANITGTIVNGSTSLTLSASSAGGATPIAAGNYLRIGHATTTTLPVYKVASVNGTAVELERPYVNPSVAIGTSLTTLALGWVISATVDAAAAGLRVTECYNVFNGISVMEPYPNKIMNVSCNVNLGGTVMQNNQLVSKAYLSSTGAITSGVYTEGNGTYAQIFKAELISVGYSGFINRTFLPDNYPLYSVSGTTYNTMGLTFSAPAKDFTAQNFKFGEVQDAIIALDDVTGTQYSTLNTIFSSTTW